MEELKVQLKLNKNGSVKASWSKITGAKKYSAYMYQVGASTMIYNEKELKTTSYTSPPDLTDNKQYQVVVVAHLSATSRISDGKKILIPLGFYDDVPLAVPKNVKAVANTVAVTVSFSKVPRATGYDILFDNKVSSVTETSKKFTGLKPKSSHTYAVQAKNASKKGAYSTKKTITTLPQTPAVPTGIKKVAAGNSVTISWNAAGAATGYDIEFGGKVYGVTGTSKKFTGLTAASTYTFRIRAKNADAVSAYTAAMSVTMAPVPPKTVSAVSTENTVTVNWSPVAKASGYVVKFNNVNYSMASTKKSNTFTGLAADTEYTYLVCSVGTDGMGEYSAVKKIKTLAMVPTAPLNDTRSSTEKAVTISWGAVSGATGYDVLFDGVVYSVTGTSRTFTGLSANSSHSYQIRCKIGSRVGTYGTVKTVRTTPAAPSAVTATSTKDAVTISWGAVSGATSYDILFGGKVYRVTDTTKTITGLTPGTDYSYSVRVNNADGSSAYGSSKKIATIPNPPQTPIGISAEATTDAVTVKWQISTGAASYDLIFNQKIYHTTEASKTISGLEDDVAYTYQVRANNAGGSSAYSAIQTITTLLKAPDMPKNVTTEATSDTVTVNWSAVPKAAGYEVLFDKTVYKVKETSKTIKGLESCTSYSCQVRAQNAAGVSAYSEVNMVKTHLGIPTGIKAKATTKSVTVSFNPVAKASDYDIEFDGKVFHIMSKTKAKVTRFCKVFKGLKANSKHTYCVKANNAEGSSPYSAQKTIRTGISKKNGLQNNKRKKKFPDGTRSYLGIDPVNALTGAFLWSYTWLEELGKDELHFTTMYDSQRESELLVLGKKWTYDFAYQLKMDDEYAYFELPSGDVIPFCRNIEKGSFESATGSPNSYTMKKQEDGSYFIDDMSGTVYQFGSNLSLAQIVENGEVVYQFKTDKNGQMICIEGSHGAFLTFDYQDGYIAGVADAMGNKVRFSYANGNLVSAINPDGDGMTFTYDEEDNLLTISDFMGKVYLTNLYDVQGRIVEQQTAGRGTSLADYDEEAHTTVFTDEQGNETRYTYDEYGHMVCVEQGENRTCNRYNESGQLVEQTDVLGNTLQMAYDEFGRMNQVTHPDGTMEQVFYDENNQPSRVINRDGTDVYYQYDKHGNLIEIKDEREKTASYAYDDKDNLISYTDKNGNIWTYSYDENNHLAKAADPLGKIYEYKHDLSGRLLSYTSPEGRGVSYRYSAMGKLLQIEDNDGIVLFDYDKNGNRNCITNKMEHQQRLKYNEMGQVSLATDFMGNEYHFFYDARGNLTKKTDPLGYTELYEYDMYGNNTARTDKNGNMTSYTFDAAKQLTEVKDAAGGMVKYVYDTMGQVKTIVDALERQTAYSYDKAGYVTSVTNALGDSVNYTYDAAGNLLTKTDEAGHVTAYTYDGEGALLTIKSDAGVTTFTYDSLGRVSEVKDSAGHTQKAVYDADGNQIGLFDKEENCTHYVYNKAGHLVEKAEPDGGKTLYQYDKNGNCVQTTDAEKNVYAYTYNANQQIVAIIDPLGKTTVYEYDAKGQLVGQVDANGGKTVYVYDGNGNIISETNPLGGVKTYVYDCLNRLIEITDEEGHKQSYKYDAIGNRTSYRDANGNRWTYTYDAVNHLTAVTAEDGGCLKMEYTKTGKIARVTDQEGTQTSYSYDSMDRLQQMSDAMNHSIYYTYDSLGRVRTQKDANGKTTEYGYSPNGNLLSVTDADGNRTNYTYNALGQVKTVTDANGNVTAYEYDMLGQTVSVTDALGGRTVFTYTKNGQIATMTNAKNVTTSYHYDACGNLIQTIDALGNTVSYEYDAMNNRIRECLPREGKQTCTTLYQYDKRGCMIREITPMAAEKNYTYDGNCNIISIVDEENNETKVCYNLNNLPIQMNYSDSRTASFRYNKRGELVELKDWNGVTSMEQDCLGRITKVTDHNGRITEHMYDAAGNRTGIIYPDNSMVRYGYDNSNRLEAVMDAEGKITKYNRDAVGNVLSIEVPESRIIYEYNPNGQPINVKYQLKDTTCMEEQIAYDALGCIVERKQIGNASLFTKSTAYTYDVLGQLLSCEEGGNTEAYHYDVSGNRVAKLVNGSEVAAYEYNAVNQLTSMNENGNSYSYSYDKRGNLTKEMQGNSPIRQYTYDSANHMVSAINLENGNKTEYGYNAFHMRVRNTKTLTSGENKSIKEISYVTDYLSRTNNELMAYEQGTEVTRTTFGREYERLNQKTTSAKTFFQSDLYHSPLFATDEQGELLYYAERDIWGKRKRENVSDASLEGNLRFTTYCYDDVIGKHYALARFYDETKGRMLSPDPIKRGQRNAYAYCDNDPVNHEDSTGEIANVLIGGLIGGTLGGLSGFAGATLAQIVNRQQFDAGKAWGAAANGAITGMAKGALISSGAGIAAALATDLAAGTLGSAAEQKIGTGRVNIRRSLTGGLTNAISGAIFGNNPFQSMRSALGRGAGAGAAAAAINNISEAFGMHRPMYMPEHDPRALCSTESPFENGMDYGREYGYRKRKVFNTGRKKRFNFDDFFRDVAVGAVTGGMSGAAFYGMGKAVTALSGSVRKRSKGGSKTSGVGNPVGIAGKGSTGRTVPNSINEQMAMHQVQSNPLDNVTELPFKLKDERWSASDSWVKMQSIVENSDRTKSTIHFVYNKITGEFDDFKFK